MSGEKEIRTKIASIRNTQKITKAMQMVAASKMRRAQERMAATRPYAGKIRQVIGHLAQASAEYRHPFLEARAEVRGVGLIVVSTDRGLCGGLNVNLFKTAMREIAAWRERGAAVRLCLIGAKGTAFFKRLAGVEVAAQAAHLGDAPKLEAVIGQVKTMLDAYVAGEIDRLLLVENEFVNTMSQRPRASVLLPTPPAELEEMAHHWDYLYEPGAREVLDALLMRYIESLVYQGVVENVACEMAARMVAMKSASDNAGALIDELQLIYNKARQAAITQEISEIVGGAAAV